MTEFESAPLVRAAGDLWPQATRARFLEAVADGTLPPAALARWLTQDYLFARGLASFQAILTARAPRPALRLLIDGLSALEAELAWFEGHAARLGLDLAGAPHPVGRRYVDFLIASAYVRPVPVLLAILFGVEVAYLAAWSALRPEGPHAEFVQRWSSPAFRGYVRGLRALAEAEPHPDQQAAFDEVLRHERDFWQMAWEV